MRRTIRLNESELKRMISESVKQTIRLNEVSASLADKAAGKALTIGREGFGKYGSYYDGIPHDSYHGKKYMQGNRFLQYRNKKLGIDKGYSIYYPDGTGNVIALKDPNGNVCTKPCHSIEELEMEYNKLQNESIRRMFSESVRKVLKESESSELEDYFWGELEAYAENNQSHENYKELVEIAEEAKQAGFNLLPCLRDWYNTHKEYYDRIYDKIETII